MADLPAPTTGTRTQPLPDEAAVIARAADGDRTSFAQLMEHYQSACYGLAWRLLGDPDQAADATQDAFIHAYRAIGSYRGGIFRSWLLRITANASYDILRRQQRRPAGCPGPRGGSAGAPDHAAVNPDVEAKAEMYGYPEQACAAAGRSANRDRAVRRLRMNYNEAAMTQSALTVKSRIHRGRLRLRGSSPSTGNSS
jgi:RNA polymerase sigma-70 factor (ECF subfamily)